MQIDELRHFYGERERKHCALVMLLIMRILVCSFLLPMLLKIYSTALLLFSLLFLKLFRRDQVQLGLHGQQELLIGGLLFLFALKFDFFALFALRLLDGFLDFNLLL